MLDSVVVIARDVARFQLKHFRNVGMDHINMKAAKETVSFVDVESEKLLMENLKNLVPEAGFYGEESGKSGDQEYLWVVDPLDGTTNFLNGLEHFSISIALVEAGKVQLGLVFKPYTGEWIGAERNKGVLFNGKKIGNKQIKISAEEALFVTGFPYRSKDLNDPFFICADRVLKLGRGIRRSGSAALDLAYLGVGWFGGFWESDLQPYDAAAGVLIMELGGIEVTNHRGQAYDLFKDRMMVAAQPGVHSALLREVQNAYNAYL